MAKVTMQQLADAAQVERTTVTKNIAFLRTLGPYHSTRGRELTKECKDEMRYLAIDLLTIGLRRRTVSIIFRDLDPQLSDGTLCRVLNDAEREIGSI